MKNKYLGYLQTCFLAAGALLLFAACSGTPNAPGNGAAGDTTGGMVVSLAVTADDIDLVEVVVTDNGNAPLFSPITQALTLTTNPGTGQITATGIILGIPAGLARLFTINAYSGTEVVCSGSATADILVDQVAAVNVIVQCLGEDTGGGVINGEFNNAPVIISITPIPLNVNTNDSFGVTAVAEDPDDNPITYQWSSDCGLFAPENAAGTTWTAPATADSCVISLTVTDSLGGQASLTFPPITVSSVIPPGLLVFDPDPELDFGTIPFDSSTSVGALMSGGFRVMNVSGGPLTIVAQIIAGDAADFTITPLLTPSGFFTDQIIENEQFFVVQVVTNPQSAGMKLATLQLDVSDGMTVTQVTYDIRMNAQDVAGPSAFIAPSDFTGTPFGEVARNGFAIANLSSGPLPTSLVGISGDVSSFVVDPGSFSTTLDPGEVRGLRVVYLAGSTTPSSITLDFDVDGNPVQLAIDGSTSGTPPSPELDSVTFLCDSGGNPALMAVELMGDHFSRVGNDFTDVSLDINGGALTVPLSSIPGSDPNAVLGKQVIVAGGAETLPSGPLTFDIIKTVDSVDYQLAAPKQVYVPTPAQLCDPLTRQPVITSARFVCTGDGTMDIELHGGNFSGAGGDFTNVTVDLDDAGPATPVALGSLTTPPAMNSIIRLPYTGGAVSAVVTDSTGTPVPSNVFTIASPPNPAAACPSGAPVPPVVTTGGYECQTVDFWNATYAGAGLANPTANPLEGFDGSSFSIAASDYPSSIVLPGVSNDLLYPSFNIFSPYDVQELAVQGINFGVPGTLAMIELKDDAVTAFGYVNLGPDTSARAFFTNAAGRSNYVEGPAPNTQNPSCSILSLGSELAAALPSNPVDLNAPVQSAVAGDFDGDGDPDLIVVSAGTPGSVHFIDNDISGAGATGALIVAATVPAGDIPAVAAPTIADPLPATPLIAADDFDGTDGPDVALIFDGTPGQVVAAVNASTGQHDFTFTATDSDAVGNNPIAIASGRLRNARTIADLVVGTADGIDVLLGAGDGTFSVTQSLALTGVRTVAMADIDPSNAADEVLVSHGTDAAPLLTIFSNDGNGTLTSGMGIDLATLFGVTGSTALKRPFTLTPFDAEGDGDTDLMLGGMSPFFIFFLHNGGTGNLSIPPDPQQTAVLAGIGLVVTRFADFADVDGDGLDDIITINQSFSGAVNTLLGCPMESDYMLPALVTGCRRGSSNPALGPSGWFSNFGIQDGVVDLFPVFLIADDFDGDGRTDVVTVNGAAGSDPGSLTFVPGRNPPPPIIVP